MINDITADQMEKEILLTDTEKSDDFEKKWHQKRIKKGSISIELNAKKMPKITQPQYLSFVGHGQYDSSMTMLNFLLHDDQEIIDKMQQILTQYPTIKRINLYACKSGLPSNQYDKNNLAKRLTLLDPEIDRTSYGALSYAEYFIIKLEQSFKKSNLPFPENLSVVACLGDVKENNGKVGVSKAKRKLSQEYYQVFDYHSYLTKLDCDIFLSCYQNGLSLIQTTTAFSNKVNFFNNPTLTSSQSFDSLHTYKITG
jgi:hypothetical protein